jgi:hypothetical protein
VPLYKLQKLRRLGLRPQLPHDEDEDRIPEGARPRAIVQRWRDQVGEGAGTILLLGLCMLERFLIYLSIYLLDSVDSNGRHHSDDRLLQTWLDCRNNSPFFTDYLVGLVTYERPRGHSWFGCCMCRRNRRRQSDEAKVRAVRRGQAVMVGKGQRWGKVMRTVEWI